MSTVYSDRQELLVCGYVRNIEKEYETLCIPEEIGDIIYSYQRSCDEWDKDHSNKLLIIDSNKGIVSFENESEMTAFGKQIVCKGMFKWTLKIISIKARIFEPCPYIGIIDCGGDNLTEHANDGSWETVGYQLCAGNNGLWGRCDGFGSYQCLWCKVDDVLEIIMDLNNGTLRYTLNDKDCGIAFDDRIVDCEYNKYGCDVQHVKARDMRSHMDQYKFEHLAAQFNTVTTQVIVFIYI